MNTKDFKAFYEKVEHELERFTFKNRLLNIYNFNRDNMILSIEMDSLVNIKVYTKIFDDYGVAVDLNYIMTVHTT